MEKPIIDRELLSAVFNGKNYVETKYNRYGKEVISFHYDENERRQLLVFSVDPKTKACTSFEIYNGSYDKDRHTIDGDSISFRFSDTIATIHISSKDLSIDSLYSALNIQNLWIKEDYGNVRTVLQGYRKRYGTWPDTSNPGELPSKFTLETYLPEQKEPDYEEYSILESKTLYKIISSHVVSYQTANAIYCILKHMGVAEDKIGPLFEALLSNLTLSDKMKRRMFAGEEGINKLNKTVSDIAGVHYYTPASFAEMLTNLSLPIDEKCTSANFGDDYKATFSYISPDQPSVNRKRVYASFKGDGATSLGFSTANAKFYVHATEDVLTLKWIQEGSANVLRIYSDGYVDYGFMPNEKDVSSSITVYDFSTAQESKDSQNEFVQTCKEIEKECGSKLTTDIDISKEILRSSYFNKIIRSIIRRCVGRNNTQGQELALVYLQNIFTPLAYVINPEVAMDFIHILEKNDN